MKLNTDKLLDRILVARPNPTPDDVRRLAPALAHLPEAELVARITRAQRRSERELAHHQTEHQPAKKENSWT